MNIRPLLPWSIVLGMALPEVANAQHQTVIDEPEPETLVFGIAAAPGSGTYAASRRAGAPGSITSIFRFTSDGTPVWERVLTFDPSLWPNDALFDFPTIHPWGQNGSLFESTRAYMHDQFGEQDTAIARHSFVALDDQGNIAQQWTVLRNMVYPEGWSLDGTPAVRRVAIDPSTGGCYLMLDYHSNVESLDLIRLSHDGEVLWARSVGTPWVEGQDLWEETFPTQGDSYSPGTSYTGQLTCSVSGEAYIANMSDNPYAVLRVRKVTPDGQLGWSRTYDMVDVAFGTGHCTSAAMDPDGNLHVLARYGYPNVVNIDLRIAPDGTLLSADAFDLNAPTTEFDLRIDDDGERYICARTFLANELFHLAPGGILERTTHPQTVQAPYVLRTVQHAWEVSGGRIRVGGVLEKEHQVLATITRYPQVWNLAAPEFEDCAGFSNNSAYTPVGLENFIITMDTAFISVDITDRVFTAPSTEFTCTPPPQSTPLYALCDLNVGMDGQRAAVKGHVRQNLVNAGQPVMIEATGVARLDLLDAEGRQLSMGLGAVAEQMVPTTSLVAGVYMLRAFDLHDRLKWTDRIVVQ